MSFLIIPVWWECRPVRMHARFGVQTGFAAYARRQLAPCAARESKFGVRTTSSEPKPKALLRHWSASTKSTLGC